MLFHMGMCMRLKITLHHNHLFTHEFDDYLLSSFYEQSLWYWESIHKMYTVPIIKDLELQLMVPARLGKRMLTFLSLGKPL